MKYLLFLVINLIVINLMVMNDRRTYTYVTTTNNSQEWQLFCEFNNNDQGFDYTWVGYYVDDNACLDIYYVKNDLGLSWLEGEFEDKK